MIKLYYFTIFIIFISSCSTIDGNVDNATFSAIDYRSLNGKKKQLMRVGISPIDKNDKSEVSYYKNMFTSVKDRLSLTEYMVDKVGNSVLITIPKHSIMTSDLYINTQDEYLYYLIDVLNKYPKTYIELTGHTSHIGNPSTNLRVSKIRAGTLAKFLNSNGIYSERMFITGLGAARRIDNDSTLKGKALNNRIEIKMIPIY